MEDVPDGDANRYLDFLGAATRLAPSRTALRVVTYIAEEATLKGNCRLTHKEMQRRAGASRRTMQRALHTLLGRGLIARTGTTDCGHAVYTPCWQRGDENRKWGNAFDEAWETARRQRRLRHFTPPSYPLPETGAACGET